MQPRIIPQQEDPDDRCCCGKRTIKNGAKIVGIVEAVLGLVYLALTIGEVVLMEEMLLYLIFVILWWVVVLPFIALMWYGLNWNTPCMLIPILLLNLIWLLCSGISIIVYIMKLVDGPGIKPLYFGDVIADIGHITYPYYIIYGVLLAMNVLHCILLPYFMSVIAAAYRHCQRRPTSITNSQPAPHQSHCQPQPPYAGQPIQAPPGGQEQEPPSGGKEEQSPSAGQPYPAEPPSI